MKRHVVLIVDIFKGIEKYIKEIYKCINVDYDEREHLCMKCKCHMRYHSLIY